MLRPLKSSTSLTTVTSRASLTCTALSEGGVETSDSFEKAASMHFVPDTRMIDDICKPTITRFETLQPYSSIEYLPLEDSKSCFSLTDCSGSMSPYVAHADTHRADHENFHKTLGHCFSKPAPLTATIPPRAGVTCVVQASSSGMDYIPQNLLSPPLVDFLKRSPPVCISDSFKPKTPDEEHSDCLLRDRLENTSSCLKRLEIPRAGSEGKISREYNLISVTFSEENFSPCLKEFLTSDAQQESVCVNNESVHRTESEYSPWSRISRHNASAPQVMDATGSSSTVDYKTLKRLLSSTNSLSNIAGIRYGGRYIDSSKAVEALAVDNALPLNPQMGAETVMDSLPGAAGDVALSPSDIPLAGFKSEDKEDESKPNDSNTNTSLQSVAGKGTSIAESERIFSLSGISVQELDEEDMFYDMGVIGEEDIDVAVGLCEENVARGEERIDLGISLTCSMAIQSEPKQASPMAAASTHETSTSKASQK